MIKAKMTGKNGEPRLMFGLSAENVKRLQAGQPIAINLTEMGLEGDVLIFYGETEADMAQMLKPYINEDTVVHNER